MARYAVIVAGGRGVRMGGELPKQFLPLAGAPVLLHTLRLFAECDAIVLALPRDQHELWHRLCLEHSPVPRHTVCMGGDTRFDSVHRALDALVSLVGDREGMVAVHDGVRPLVAPEVIDACYRAAEIDGASIPYRPVVESLRQLVPGGGSLAVDRSRYISVQTPQVFDLHRLHQAYARGYEPCFTDDASVWEAAFPHSPIALVEGNVENIKLTTPQDMHTAEHLLASR